MGCMGEGPYDSDTALDEIGCLCDDLKIKMSKVRDSNQLFCLIDIYFKLPYVSVDAANVFKKYVPILYKMDEGRGWVDKTKRKETVDKYVKEWKQICDDWGCEEYDDEE